MSRTQYDGSLTVIAVANYGYDGWKTNGGSGGFAGQENWDIWADLDSTNALVARRIFGNSVDSLVACIAVSGGGPVSASWYVTDRQGSVLGILSASGSVTDTLAYDGFGNIVSESNPGVDDVYGYTGRIYEQADNAYNYRDRWLMELSVNELPNDASLLRKNMSATHSSRWSDEHDAWKIGAISGSVSSHERPFFNFRVCSNIEIW